MKQICIISPFVHSAEIAINSKGKLVESFFKL